MIPKAAEVRLTPEDRSVLEARVRAPTSEQRDVLRAKIVLMAAEGRSTRSIAAAVGTMPRTVSLWRGRFAREGLSGLAERRRRGRSPKYDAQTGRRILAVLENSPPAGFARWTGPLIAAELGDVHEQQVWRVLRAQRIDLSGRKSWCESDDPRVCRQGRRCGRPLHGATRERDRHLRRREALDPSIGACAGLSEAAQRPGIDWPESQLHRSEE